VVARHPTGASADGFWIVGGRLVDWGALASDPDELERRTNAAVAGGSAPDRGAWLPADELDELRILALYLDRHPDTRQLALDPVPERERLLAFVSGELGVS
jgi:hypothetical protein